jgi:hypothetical protein
MPSKLKMLRGRRLRWGMRGLTASRRPATARREPRAPPCPMGRSHARAPARLAPACRSLEVGPSPGGNFFARVAMPFRRSTTWERREIRIPELLTLPPRHTPSKGGGWAALGPTCLRPVEPSARARLPARACLRIAQNAHLHGRHRCCCRCRCCYCCRAIRNRRQAMTTPVGCEPARGASIGSAADALAARPKCLLPATWQLAIAAARCGTLAAAFQLPLRYNGPPSSVGRARGLRPCARGFEPHRVRNTDFRGEDLPASCSSHTLNSKSTARSSSP